MVLKESTINQRISLLVQALDSGNKLAFSKRIGMSNQGLGEIIGERQSTPSYPKLTQMLRALPQVRIEWLLLGEGEMLKSAESLNNNSVLSGASTAQEEAATPYMRAHSNANLRVLAVQVGADEEENIGFVSTRAAAGYAAGGFIEPEFIRHLPSFRLPDSAYRNGTFRCFQVSGDSMQSTLYAGDWVVCRFVENWSRDIRDNRVYVVVSEENVVVKRVLNRFNERGQLTLQSDNIAFPIQFLDGAEVREVWEGVGRLTRQFINPRFDVPDELAHHRADIAEIMLRLERLESERSASIEN